MNGINKVRGLQDVRDFFVGKIIMKQRAKKSLFRFKVAGRGAAISIRKRPGDRGSISICSDSLAQKQLDLSLRLYNHPACSW
jgi:hypothetical protein